EDGGDRRGDVVLVDSTTEVDARGEHPADGGHPGPDEHEHRQLAPPARRLCEPNAKAGDDRDEPEAAEHEEPGAESDRVGVRLVPGEDLASGRVFRRAVLVDEDDPHHPEGDGERAGEGPAAILRSVHRAVLLSMARERAGTVRARRTRARTFE